MLVRPCPAPAVGGVYAWFFSQVPAGIDPAGCYVVDGWTLLYVGISPKEPPTNGRPPSRSTLRQRLRAHFSGNAAGSTLRKTLGCLLAEELDVALRRVGSGDRYTLTNPGEQRLDAWMADHCRVAWRAVADLKQQSLAFLQAHFGKSGPWYYDIARGRDERPVRPDRERKSSGSETTFAMDLTDPEAIEVGVLAMADDVWDWCEKTGARGRTVTVKIKWADFQQSTRSRSLGAPVDSRAVLHEASLALIRSVYPPPKGIRLVGVTLSNFAGGEARITDELSLLDDSRLSA